MYQQENSNLAPHILIAADTTAGMDEAEVTVLSEGEEDEEVVVTAYPNAMSGIKQPIQDRRSRTVQRPSAKNLFCKSQGIS